MIIYHITTRSEWRAAQETRDYTAHSLASDGFIHASTAEQMIEVANAFHRDQTDLVLLCVDTDLLKSELHWEPPVHPGSGTSGPPLSGDLFPHIYGPINFASVVQVLDLVPNPQGMFDLPDALH